MAAIFYYVTVTPFVFAQFCPTFDMLFSGPNSTRNCHKTLSCNFFGVNQHIDPTIPLPLDLASVMHGSHTVILFAINHFTVSPNAGTVWFTVRN